MLPVKQATQAIANLAPNPDATRFGFASWETIDLSDRIGPFYVGLTMILMRGLAVFENVKPWVRNETDDAMENEKAPALKQIERSAWECANDVFRAYGQQGFAVLESLTGLDPHVAFKIFCALMPPLADKRSETLTGTLDYLLDEADAKILTLDKELRATAHNCLGELIAVCRTGEEWVHTYLDGLEKEMDDRKHGRGAGLSAPSKRHEHAYEQVRRIPKEDKATVATGEMVSTIGREIGRAVTTAVEGRSGADERGELERLRARNAELEQQLASERTANDERFTTLQDQFAALANEVRAGKEQPTGEAKSQEKTKHK